MASDYLGDPKAFALVVPVPTVVARKDILVVGNDLVDKLDAYSAPRLSEYYDEDPCAPVTVASAIPAPTARFASGPRQVAARDEVTIEARYEVGVYGHPDPLGEAERRAHQLVAGKTITASRLAPDPCSAPTSGRACISSSPR